MRKLSRLIRICRRFMLLPWGNKKLLMEALIFSAVVRAIILVVPFKKYKKYLGKYNEETPYEIDLVKYEAIRKVAWAVEVISLRTPWESKCLVQAVVAQRMLKKRRIKSTVYLGVNKVQRNKINAHAWLRCGQFFVTGGYSRNDYTEVARFAN